MKNDAREHRTAVAGRHDTRLKERLVFAPRGEHFATDVVTRQDEKRGARQNVESGAVSAEKRHPKDRAMGPRKHPRESTFARVVETAGQLGRESAGGQRLVPRGPLTIFRLGTRARRR
jgi:hypothetical protein